MSKETEAQEINLRDKVEVEYIADTAYSKKGEKTRLHPIAAKTLVDRKIAKIVKAKEEE